MNKVTLSLVALATMGGTAQAQTTEMTQEQKDQALKVKKAAIDELRIQLNKASNEISACKNADVRETYLLQLSTLEAELNEIYTNEEVYEISEEKIEEFKSGIEKAKESALNAQKPYDVKETLNTLYTELYNKYLVAVEETEKYPNVGSSRKELLEGIGIDAIGNTIATFDLTTSDIVAQEGNIKADIKSAMTQIETTMKNIAEDEESIVYNESSYKQVLSEYEDAKKLYDEQLSDAIKLLPTPIYEDWQKAAIDELNAQYRVLNSAKKDNETAYANKEADKHATANIAAIVKAIGAFSTIVSNYSDKVNIQEEAYAEVSERASQLQGQLDEIKELLKKSEITSCDAAVNNTQTLIDQMKAEIQDAYEKHTVNEYKEDGYKAAVGKITNAKNNIKDGNGNKYTLLINNKAAYVTMVAGLDALKAKITEAEKKAQTVSEDKKYNAAEHFTATLASLNKAAAALEQKVEGWNTAKKPTCVDNESAFNSEVSKIEASITSYSKSTANSLDYYNQTVANIKDAQTALDALKAVVEKADPSVTIDGKLGGTTYETQIKSYQADIDKVSKGIESANKQADAKHEKALKSLTSSDLHVSAINAHKESYASNKADYDKATAQKAAETYIATAENLLTNMQKEISAIEAAGDVYGEKYNTEVATKTAEYKSKLTNVSDTFAKEKDTYAEKKGDLDAVAKIVAELSKVSNDLKTLNEGTETEVGLEAFIQETKALEDNYAAEVALDKAISDADKAIENMRTDLVGKDLVAENFYDLKLESLQENLDKISGNIKKSYENKTADADKAGYEKQIKDVLATAQTYADAVIPNKNAYDKQVKNAEILQKAWQDAYDAVANGDLSDAAKDYLAELAKEQEKINTLKNDIVKAHANGQSVEKDGTFKTTKEEIEDAIVKIQNESINNYDENVKNTNKEQHDAFVRASDGAEKAFTNAVDILNAYAKIKNPASATAVANLLSTHDAIYAYADKIRANASAESEKYSSYTAAKYGVEECIYNSAEFISTATEYQNEINAQIKNYQSTVDTEAQKAFSPIVTDAESQLAAYQAKVANYGYDKGKATAFKDIAAVISKAKAATPEKTVKYAVKIDEWWDQLDGNLTNTLDEALVAACDAEKAYLVKDIENVYNTEISNIATLCLTDEQKTEYRNAIDEVKGEFDDVVETYAQTTDYVEAVRKAHDAYFGTDANVKNSDPYQEALNTSALSKANLEAYDKIMALHDAAQKDYADIISDINQLIIGHMPGQVTADLESLKKNIEIVEENVDYWKEKGLCTENLDYIKTTFIGSAEILKVVKERAISYEIEMLGKKTDEVKEQYNQVAKQHGLESVKEYDAKIERLYTDLLINGRTDAEAKESIEWKWNNQKQSKMTYADALNALIAHEGAVAALLNELNGMYDNDDRAEATTTVEGLISETEGKVVEIETWANYKPAIEAKYGKVATSLSDELSSIKEDYEAKKGTILFHEDGLTYDIEQLNAEIALVSDEIKNLYNGWVAVDEAIASVDGMAEKAANQIADVTEKIESLTYAPANMDELMEDWTDQLEAIDGIKEQITLGDIDTPLESCKALVDDLNVKVAYDLKGALYNDASLVINDMSVSLEAVDEIINNGNYNAERYASLKDSSNDIAEMITSANKYNDLAHNGYVVTDDNTYELVDIDYTSEAYPVIEETISTIKSAIEKLKDEAESTSFIYGDADGNKLITVNDYSAVRRLVLDDVAFDEVEEAKRYASDMDSDGQFTVADMNQVANLIMGNATTSRAMARVRSTASSNEISITKQSEEVTVFGKTVKVAVNLNNSNAFSAGQFDITLPAGMTISGNELTERSNGHEIFVNEIGDGTYRVVVATIENKEFNGNSGDLVVLDVAVDSNVADGNVQLSNAIFADVQGRAFQLGDVEESEATGIDSIKAATAKERVYSIGGQIMKTVKKGINIIVGENGEAKKVVKK